MRPTRFLCAAACAALLLGGPLAEAAPKKKSRARRAAQGGAAGSAYKAACTRPSFPQPPPATAPEIDSQCGANGAGSGAEGAQNAAKNNFCATGTPRAVTVKSLTALQARVEKNKAINFGDQNSPPRLKGPTAKRAALRALGEGRLVTLKAYVLIARQEGGESVNCGKNVPNQPAFHDIHISLVSSPDTASDAAGECTGVVAEMSPHHRPDSWTHANVQKVANAKALVRVTGQLFFDSSHYPCSGGQPVRSNPKRVSLWEIHPVYKFEVCTANCNGAGAWLPLDQWALQN